MYKWFHYLSNSSRDLNRFYTSNLKFDPIGLWGIVIHSWIRSGKRKDYKKDMLKDYRNRSSSCLSMYNIFYSQCPPLIQAGMNLHNWMSSKI